MEESPFKPHFFEREDDSSDPYFYSKVSSEDADRSDNDLPYHNDRHGGDDWVAEDDAAVDREQQNH